MLNLIIFGSPGAGKGTQAKMLAKQLDLLHISSGEILRQEAKNKKLATQINSYLDKGKLVPDELIIKLITERLEERLGKIGIIFDGYPRTLSQADFLDKLFERKKLKSPLVISLELEEDVAIQRILSRSKDSNRSDDKLKVITERLKIYHRDTEPLLEYYKSKKRLIKIDGRPDIETVNKAITQQIKKEVN